ncbi:MAG: fibronectin type III domain-containing protein [Acidobacteria bacterium]|nr:fibronectin type III domain-containing protein [Acidobacteriota bacterium]
MWRFTLSLVLFTHSFSAATASSVKLMWDANPENDIVGYYIYRSQVSGTGYARINQAPVTTTTYIDAALTEGVSYYYVVTAVNTRGELRAIPLTKCRLNSKASCASAGQAPRSV